MIPTYSTFVSWTPMAAISNPFHSNRHAALCDPHIPLRVVAAAQSVPQLACSDYKQVFSRKIVDLQANFWYGRLITLNPHYAQVMMSVVFMVVVVVVEVEVVVMVVVVVEFVVVMVVVMMMIA
jgi:hypothetical protein